MTKSHRTKTSSEDDSAPGLIDLLKSLLRKKPHHQKGADLAGEIHDLMNEGQAKGLITGEESEMVSGVLDLRGTMAHSIMIPRTEISCASINSTLGELIKLVSDCGHTRIPIYKETVDEIVGILHAKDLLKLWGEDPDSEIPLGILREPLFIPGSRMVSDLLKDLKEKKTHLALVADEYGGTAGIITIEDILEEIVGEILDEHDREPPLMEVLDDGSILIDARLDIEKMEEHYRMSLPEGDFESVGGFIIYLLGRIPKVGETIEHEGLSMTVKSADDRRIHKILVERRSPSSPPEETRAPL